MSKFERIRRKIEKRFHPERFRAWDLRYKWESEIDNSPFSGCGLYVNGERY